MDGLVVVEKIRKAMGLSGYVSVHKRESLCVAALDKTPPENTMDFVINFYLENKVGGIFGITGRKMTSAQGASLEAAANLAVSMIEAANAMTPASEFELGGQPPEAKV